MIGQNLENKITNIVKKIISIGEGGVGKTTLFLKYVTGTFSDSTKMTIGSDFFTKKIYIDDKGDHISEEEADQINLENKNITKELELLLWDFAGEKRFRFLLPGYVIGSSVVLACFDLSRPKTLFVLEEWLDIIMKNKNENQKLIIYLVGTKKDLVDSDHLENGLEDIIDIEFIKSLKEKFNIKDIYYVSSKTGENVDELFTAIIKDLV
ncbi:MAG: Rab family GTPase [Promethearchaeota archaeon]